MRSRTEPAAGNPRAAVQLCLQAVLQQRRSLTQTLAQHKATPWVCEVCYGVLRHYDLLQARLSSLSPRAIRKRDDDLRCLLLAALYQLLFMREAPHAVVNESVRMVRRLRKNWASSWVNAVLRAVPKQQASWAQQADESWYQLPDWLAAPVRQRWPDQYAGITANSYQQAPMFLRVNRCKNSVADYSKALDEAGMAHVLEQGAPAALRLLAACPVDRLPGFATGSCAVQDLSPQRAVALIETRPGQRWLDLCSAPGGKAAALYEQSAGQIELLAVDSDAARLQQQDSGMVRLGHAIASRQGDGTDLPADLMEQRFDGIMLDAPCSGSGVLRRHPDIRFLRRADDIPVLCATQRALLRQAWRLLKPGGQLWYMTCSLLPEENEAAVLDLLQCYDDAALLPLQAASGQAARTGWQFFPEPEGGDGFFVAALYKHS